MSPHPPRKILIPLCYAAMMALSIGINLLPVFLTTLSVHFGGPSGLTHEALGRIGAVLFAGLTAGILLTGPLADRFGTKPFALMGNLLTCLSLVACALAPSYATLLAACFCVGLGAGILDMVLSPVVAALEPERRSAAMNLLHSFYCLGAAATILIGMVALAFHMSWTAVCLVLAPFPLVVALLMGLLPFPPHVQEGHSRVRLRDLMRVRWFVLCLVAIALGGATELGMAQWLPAYAETILGYGKGTAALGLLLFSLAMALGRIVIGLASHRLSPVTLMFACCASSVVLFLAASFSPLPWLAYTCCILAGFAGSALWPTTLALAADRYPQGGATMFGALAALGNAGGIVMPWLVGSVADTVNLRWGLATSAVAPLLMAG
ncbi:MAG: MFS transporter, partial [Verrucomicrobiae bacterium]|nr:MFS transporter [Verrucomicrobiae bacterium]